MINTHERLSEVRRISIPAFKHTKYIGVCRFTVAASIKETMKQSVLLALGALLLAGTTAMASEADAPARVQRVGVFYDLTTLYPEGADNVYTNGFGVGYSVDFRVSNSLPLYVGTGLDARFLFYEKDLLDDEYLDAVEQEAHVTFINFNVPVNVSYRVPVAEGFYLTPELGLDFRVQAYGHAKIDTEIENVVPGMNLGEFQSGSRGINLFSKDEMGSEHLRRFQMGWHAALRFEYRHMNLGLSYGTDFVKLHKNLGAGHFLVSLGYTF